MGYHDANGIYRRIGELANLSLTQLKAISVQPRQDDGRLVQVTDGRIFVYSRTSVLAADNLFVVDAKGGGKFLLAPGYVQHVEFPIAFGTADAAVLATAPTNFFGRVIRGYWRVTTAFSGGSSSAIGVSSGTASGHTTKGDYHGGAGGDVEAALTAGKRLGTIGADIAAGAALGSGETVRFDRITSAFTAGAGFAGLSIDVIDNPGA